MSEDQEKALCLIVERSELAAPRAIQAARCPNMVTLRRNALSQALQDPKATFSEDERKLLGCLLF